MGDGLRKALATVLAVLVLATDLRSIARVGPHLMGRGWVFLSLLMLHPHPSIQAESNPRFAVTHLGEMTDLKFVPSDMNDKGQIAGRVAFDPRWDKHASIACLLDLEEGPIKLGTLNGDRFSESIAINNQGVLVGQSSNPGSDQGLHRSFVWCATDGLQDIGSLGSQPTYVQDINEHGVVLGTSLTSEGELHGFFWTKEGGIVDIGGFGGESFDLSSLNVRGQVVGTRTKDAFNTESFLWSNEEGRKDLGTLGGKASVARGINDLGQIVGYSTLAAGNPFKTYAFVWSATEGMRNLGSLGGKMSIANSINNKGHVVGSSMVSGTYGPIRAVFDFLRERDSTKPLKHAFLWEGGKMQDLNDVIDQSTGWVLRNAMKIDELGQILGQGEYKGNSAYFFLTPVE